jgi:protein subunit release factor B
MIQSPIVANFWARTELRIYWLWAIDGGYKSNAIDPSSVSQDTTISYLSEIIGATVSH